MVRFDVELIGSAEKIEVRVLPIDYLLAEKKFGKSTSAMDKDMRIEELAQVLFTAMKRDGQTDAANVDEFFKIFADFDKKPAPKVSATP